MLVLFYSETAPEYGKIIDKAIDINTLQPSKSTSKKAVWLSGIITASKSAIDEDFLPNTSVAENPPAYLKRSAQIYAWQQKTLNSPPKQLEDYQYTTEWFTDIPITTSFFIKEGHQNPEWPLNQTKIFFARDVKVNNIPILAEPDQYFSLRMAETGSFTLSASMLKSPPPENSNLFVGNDQHTLYKSKSAQSENQPFSVGDLKFTYESFPLNAEVSVMGTWDGTSVVPLCMSKIRPCFLAIYPGSKTQLQRWLIQTDSAMFFAGRLFSFLFLWLAFYLIAKPFRHVFEAVPFFGKAAHTALGFLCFVMSMLCVILMVIFIKLFWIIVLGFIGVLVALYYIYRPKT